MLGLEHDFRIVDTHATLDPDEASVALHGRDITPERLEREMHQAGIVRAVASPGRRAQGRSYLRANNAVARLSVDRPFVAFARLNGPRDPRDGPAAALRNLRAERDDHHARPDDVEQYSYDDRFHGFKIVPPYDGLPNEDVLTRLEAADLPVIVHGGKRFPPDAVERELLGYDFPVILASFGGYPLDSDLMNRTLDLLDDHDRLYLDTSAVRYREILERGVLEHPDRIVFGSGAPDVHPNVGVMEVLTLDVSEDLMRRVLAKNPARLVPALAEGADV
ncbi:putative TIM-barrel fold metal-dependent hydrolase [Halorubrum alkaliphilum]|uniref:Putative TIM-barrel fold metal-dependent hydrolase n=1 Tax=Halorubrum alkaliphilum TaxID=261290 RepID=A0A8T4GI07_9EURY|nr:amidohydrolase family protein [Halorubrum alkaliphilum]MBP1923916.1 putative TIM-barrel fold metal-dependent hydrolase [Halorubrum alkaliphilum]